MNQQNKTERCLLCGSATDNKETLPFSIDGMPFIYRCPDCSRKSRHVAPLFSNRNSDKQKIRDYLRDTL